MYTGGAYQPGYAGTVTPNGIGFDFDVDPTALFPPSQLIQVRVQGTDVDSNAIDTTYSFTTAVGMAAPPKEIEIIGHAESGTPPPDTSPPFLENRNPAPGATAIPIASNVFFRISDTGDGVDGSTLDVYINSGVGFVLAIDGSVFQAGFVGTIVPTGAGGFDVDINPAADFQQFTLIQVRVVAKDLAALQNELDVIYTFTSIDTGNPIITDRFPPCDSQDDTFENALVSFRVDDPGGIGVDQTTLDVRIKNGPFAPFQDAIVNGIFLAPYNGGASVITPFGLTGIDVVIDKTDTYVFNNFVTVEITCEDLHGNSVTETCVFNTSPPPSPPPIEPPLLQIEGFPLDIYRFIIFEIRKQDLQGSPRPGSLFLKRYLEGFNRVWQQVVSDIQRVPQLWSVEDIRDAHLQFLKTIVGWTDAPLLKKITEAISDASLRRLIAVSGRLWKTRGPESSIIDVLSLLTVARLRIWNWFDFRWVLDETELGEEHEGRDPWMIDLPSTVQQELLIDQSTFFNLATGNAVSAVVPLSVAGAAKAGDVFKVTSGPQNGNKAAILSIVGAGPTTINLVQDPLTNHFTGAYAAASWEIIDERFQPDDAYRSNLRIVDDGTLDRTLVKRVLRLMRATGERFDITYLSFLDLFSVEADDSQWEPLPSGNLVVEDGLLKLNVTAISEETFAIVQEAFGWTEYVFSARVRGNSGVAAARWGMMFYRSSASNYYAFLLDTFNQELILRKVVAGVPTTITTVLLNSIGFPIASNQFYTLRASIVDEGATNRIQLFADGFLLVSTTDSAHSDGTVGFAHDTNASIEIDEVEVAEIFKGVDSLDINEFP